MIKPFTYISVGHKPDEAISRAEQVARKPHQSLSEREARNIILGLRTAVMELKDRLIAVEAAKVCEDEAKALQEAAKVTRP